MKQGILIGVSFALVLLSGCASHRGPAWTSMAEQSHTWGYYSGDPVMRWNPDGRNMTVLTELRYTDPKGEVWVAPPGSVTDGASIPRSLWSITGGPFEGKYRNASILHDVAYDQHNRPWQECDRMFYNACRCSGVGAVEAKTMYYALYKFGHHWKYEIKKARPVKREKKDKAEKIPRAIPVDQADVDATRDWIRGNEPSLEQIEQRADTERQ